MTWGSRVKLFFGLIAVLVMVAALTVIFNQRQTQVLSSSSQIEAEHVDVGTDYGGLVVERHVAEGDTVAEGDRLFEIESLSLARDVELGLVAGEGAAVDADGTLLVRASVSGTVSALMVDQGAYAGSGGVIATIDRTGSLFATASFILSPRDFARIEDGASVDLRLPDGREITGTIADLSVSTIEGAAHVDVRVDSDALVESDPTGLMRPGTPLEATMHLRDDGVLAGVSDALDDLARRVGL
jgi:multidrug efflux pump subunit AcrA (membrane-fusion protein)